MYDHHLMSFHVHVVNQIMLLIFHNGASYLIQQYGLVIHGSCEYDFYKPSCGEDSSLDVILIIRHLPYPLEGTYLLDSVPNDLKFCINLHQPLLEYTHVDIQEKFLCLQCNVQLYDEL